MTHPAPSMLHHRHPHKCTDSPNQSSSASACTHASPSSGPDSHGHQPGSTPAPSFTQLARAVASGQPGLSLAALGQTLLGVAVWTVSLAQENLVATAYAYWLAFHAQSLAIVAVQRAVRTHQVLGGLPPSTPCPPHSWPLFPVAGPRPVFKHPSELDHSTRWSSSPLVPDQEKVMIPGDSGTPMTAAKSAGLYPFGWRRLPVILTLAQLLYLFFVAAHTITESIEHLASSGSHDANTETRFLEGIGLALPM
ncbi:hypothetical protein H4R35_007361 [Dimargaris xerosporica]|nr:hypothetical protein H4R35_007361 [Dimargaris xerosporica]